MKIVKINKTGKLYKILIDNGEVLELLEQSIINNNIYKDKILNYDDVNKIKSDNNFLILYNKVVSYINKKPRTKRDITKLLNTYTNDINIIEKCLNKLIDNRYINDELYVSSYVNYYIKTTNWGPIIIIEKIHCHGIEKNLIQKELSRVDDIVWDTKIQKIITYKIKQNKKNDRLFIPNLKNYLYYKGYTVDQINRNLKKDIV